MEPIVIIVFMSIVILLLLYAYVRSMRQLAYRTRLADEAESELKKIQAADEKLSEALVATQAQLHRVSNDTVTHLLSWRLFEDRLAQAIKESERYQLTMGVLFIDIDDFKVINDALNYEVGDALLIQVAERLQTCIRQVDSISRFTKDTFVILLAQLSKPETAAVVAQRILQALAPAFLVNERELYITVGIGIAIFPSDGQNTQLLLRSGDHALHLAKERGNHVYQFYQEKMHERSQRELAIYTSLSKESILTEFVLYYQPIVKVEDNSVVCMDALLHWQHTEFGTLAADELLGMVEKQRKANVISEWWLRTACQQFKHWQSLGFHPHLLGIPLSLKQLENSHFVYRLQQVLQELQFKPDKLLLEVREGGAVVSFDALEKAFNMLNYLGVNIAIDHFGSGFISLKHLKNVAVRYLKLDPALVADIQSEGNQQALTLIKALGVLAESLSIQVIVEGVESEAQMTALKGLGFQLMQGPFFGVPLSIREVESQYAQADTT